VVRILVLVMSQKGPQETYEFYFPIYNLFNPSSNVKLGYGTILRFERLPRQIRRVSLLLGEAVHNKQ